MAKDPVSRSVWLTEPRTGGNQPAGLSRELIVRAAVEALDAHGLAALSMRKLAAQLEVAPMSLYWHVPTKDALLELAMDEIFGEIEPVDPNLPWPEALRGQMVSVRRLFHRHPWLPQLHGRFPGIGPKTLALAESQLAVLRAAGMSVAEAGRAASVLSSFVIGFASAEVKWEEQVSGIGDDELAAQWGPRVFELARDRFPNVAAQMGDVELWSRDKQFDYGLDCILAGIRSRTGQPPK